MVDKQIQTLGNFVGGLLESLPLRERGKAIREIQRIEEEFSNNMKENLGDGPKLSLQLLRIEQIRMVLPHIFYFYRSIVVLDLKKT